MKTFVRPLLHGIALAALLAAPGSGLAATPVAPVEAPAIAKPVQANCNAVAQQVAAQYGGRARGSLQNRGGQQVCVVVVVVEGKKGERTQRIEVVVPAG